MTRDEAIKIAAGPYEAASGSWGRTDCLIDALVALGLLKLDTIDDPTFKAAGERLTGVYVEGNSTSQSPTKIGGAGIFSLTPQGAYEALDVLRKSGFKVTRDTA